MRIAYRIIVVGAIPIVVAAGIALAAWLLLGEADRVRNAAVLGGSVYRNLELAVTARDAYVHASRFDRGRHIARFNELSGQAASDLAALSDLAVDPQRKAATADVRQALDQYVSRMRDFTRLSVRNDLLAADMDDRAASLIHLTDDARARQHTSNTDILSSLAERDRKLRATRELVGSAQELRANVSELELMRLGEGERDGPLDGRQRLDFLLSRLALVGNELSARLNGDAQAAQAQEIAGLVARYDSALTGQALAPAAGSAARDILTWAERMLKVGSTRQRAVHEEMAQLLSYTVRASETEQATQNIAISTLKLGQQTTEALAERNPQTTARLIEESARLSYTIAELPISPLIQTEMIDAMDQWRAGLSRATEGLRSQNVMIEDMDRSAVAMSDGARALNRMFTEHAESIGHSVRQLLIVGAAIGLLLGSAFALHVAGSITRPLKRLQHRMLALAEDPGTAHLPEATRRDELGDMARAANFFVNEIGRRETALREAKNRADAALDELRHTQDSLLQAEKLASLGGLVAGVAHEINTPVGIALTTASVVEDEVRRFGDSAASGQLRRSELQRFVTRMTEGAGLLSSNLRRAADLVHSFKQVSADQASGERRSFDLKTWLDELLTSLGPVLRRSGHELLLTCPEGIQADTYPGALAQVFTNLITNAIAHAFEDGTPGAMRLTVIRSGKGRVRITFSDDGRGIPDTDLSRVFEPFFTTRRGLGSTGLGLHIVYNLVTGTLGGRIAIDSPPRGGTRFILDLPLALGVPAERHLPTT
jgi:signal transduction histidine kinase